MGNGKHPEMRETGSVKMTKKDEPKNHKFFISTPPIPDQCWRCRMPIWSCNVDGLPIKLAPTPLNFAEEWEARGRGITIFQTTRKQLVKIRTAADIAKDDPVAILATHECDRLDLGIPHDLFHQEKPAQPDTEGFPF